MLIIMPAGGWTSGLLGGNFHCKMNKIYFVFLLAGQPSLLQTGTLII